jgi:hypothetical protein
MHALQAVVRAPTSQQGAVTHARGVLRSPKKGSSPFAWVTPADEILAKELRKPRATGESGHQRPRYRAMMFRWMSDVPE